MPNPNNFEAPTDSSNDLGPVRAPSGCMCSMWWSLDNLRKNGFVPSGIIDVGAYEGQWTKLAQTVFPRAKVVMVEANPQKRSMLADVAKQSNGVVTYHVACVGARPATEALFFVMDSGGSSVLPENTTFLESSRVFQ